MSTLELIQGSDDWVQARVGSLGASSIADVVAKLKSGGYGASRANCAARIIGERLTGKPAPNFTTKAMLDGVEREPDARRYYATLHDVDVVQIGLMRHSKIKWTHASPDGLIGNVGLLEIKCPQFPAHLDYVEGGSIPDAYIKQMQWQMCVTGRRWCDYASFNPEVPEIEYLEERIERDDKMIEFLETEVVKFLAEIDERIKTLRAKYGLKEAA